MLPEASSPSGRGWASRRGAAERARHLVHFYGEDASFYESVVRFLGAGLALVTAWLGGELVDRLGIGVSEGANVDAPSSLRHRHVTARAR